MSPPDADLSHALAVAVREAAPKLSQEVVDRIVRAIETALEAMGMVDEFPPDIPRDDVDG